VTHRAWTPGYLVRYLRYGWLRLSRPDVVTEGFVFIGPRVRLEQRRGYGRLILGAWVHLGEGTVLRAHEGTLRIGPKVVFGGHATVNSYLDVDIGAGTLVADGVYICDFDHATDSPGVPIKDQGIVTGPVRVGPGSWLATKVTVLRGTSIGAGSVAAAHAVVRGSFPAHTVLAGVPARPVKDLVAAAAERQAARAARQAARAAQQGGTAEVPTGG
jgi:acetyltransferase-like isoleucine patch superfamily enzyme